MPDRSALGPFSELTGLRASSSENDRLSYARDLWPRHHIDVRAGRLPESKPRGVVWPESTEDVARIVALAAREGTPLAPFGAGSGVCGGTLPDARTVVVDMKRMNRARRLSASTLEVDAGAMGIRLEEDLQHAGFTLGHFPSSILCSTVGGWLAARSAGQCSGKYGKIEDMVVSLDCVVGEGELLRLHRRVRGPDLTQLVVGSEGIFGIVTSARLRIHPAPTHKAHAAFSFPDLESGIETLRALFQAGLRPAVSRLYDAFDSFMAKRGAVKKTRARPSGRSSLKELAMRLSLRLPRVMNFAVDAVGDQAFGGTLLILVFEGTSAENLEDRTRATNIAERSGGTALGEGPALHWERHRYSVSYRQAPVFMSGAFSDTMEVAASWSKLGDLYEAVREAMRPHVFVMAHLSHAYPDGCSIYFTFAGSADDDAAALAKYDAVWRDAPLAAARAGGTISHHHGVGRSKAPRLAAELGFGTEVVRALARRFDPAGIFNPGNLLPPADARRGRAPVAPTDSLRIDDHSLLVTVAGDRKLGDVEAEAETRGMSLRVAELPRGETVRSFIARGCPGAPDPFEDPADHFVAGFSATLREGAFLHVPAGPRKAVGPDLLALFWGAEERAGVIERAVLRLHRKGLSPRALPAALDRSPAITSSEERWLDDLTQAAGRA